MPRSFYTAEPSATGALAIEAHLAFDGKEYRLDTIEQRLAAAVAALRYVCVVSTAYHARGPEFWAREMERAAGDLLRDLRARESIAGVATAELVGGQEVWVDPVAGTVSPITDAEIVDAEIMEVAPEVLDAMDAAEAESAELDAEIAELEARELAAAAEREADDEANAALPWNHPAYFDGSLDEPAAVDVEAPSSQESSEGGE